MSDPTPAGTWGQAFLLWFWTNLGGSIGTVIFLSLQMESYASLSSDYGIGLIVAGVGLVTALPSLLVVPLAYIAFRELPGIVRYWPRLLTAAAVITGFFLLIVFVAGKRTLGKDASLGDVVLGGGAYWASALAAAALVYQQELFRPDDSDEAVAG